MPHDRQGLQLNAGDVVHVIPQQISGVVIKAVGCDFLIRQKNGEIWLHPAYELQRQRAA